MIYCALLALPSGARTKEEAWQARPASLVLARCVCGVCDVCLYCVMCAAHGARV